MYAVQLSSPHESPERDGEAPRDGTINVGELRSRVSSCVHLPMLSQLAPQAVKDLLHEAKASDDDTVSGKVIFKDGSSLIPKAWPRVAASGGWGVLITTICDNQRIAVFGMFFGEVTEDVEHQLCGTDSVFFYGTTTHNQESDGRQHVTTESSLRKKDVGTCEVQVFFAALSWCHVANLEAKNVKIRPDSKYAIGVLNRSHRCTSPVRLVRSTKQCLERARSKFRVSFEHIKAHEGQWQNECADSGIQEDR